MPPYQGYTLPAPSGGLNLIDPVDRLPENDAMEMVNLYPSGSVVSLRGGLTQYSTFNSSAVSTLATWTPASGATELIAASGLKFARISSPNGVDITGSTTPTSDNWQTAQFGGRTWFANGIDTVQQYSGGGSITDASFTGVTLSSLINVSSYKERIYFVESASGSVWYGGTKSLSGALTEFDASYYFKRGGYLLFAGSWTNQLASTSADLFFLCSSEGDLLFYSGSYPGDAAWTLVAKFEIGKPLSYRSFIRVDNDIWIITEQGIVPISLLFSGGPTVALNSVARKVNSLITTYARSVGFNSLWHGAHWPAGKRVYIVIPITGGDTQLLVCNTETGAWSTYKYYATAGEVSSLAIYDGWPYAGNASGKVRLMEDSRSDDGSPIQFTARLPFNFFGSRGNFKTFKDVRPIVRTQRGVNFFIGIDTDFKQGMDYGNISTVTGTSTPWGSPWGSPWSGGAEYLFDRFGLRGQGHCGALRIRGSILEAPLDFNAFEVRYEVGGQV